MARRPAPPTAPEPRRRRRSAQAQDDFRQRIVELARHIYREQGYDALTIRALTEPLGVSQMAFYAYFPNKAELVRHIWVDMLRALIDQLLGAAEGQVSALAVMQAHLHAFFDFWEQRPEQYRLFMVIATGGRAGEHLQLADEPVYRQLLQLNRERVLACAGGRKLTARTIDRQSELAYIKAIGYLHTTLGLGRYPFSDPGELRRWVVEDIVTAMRQDLGAPGA